MPAGTLGVAVDEEPARRRVRRGIAQDLPVDNQGRLAQNARASDRETS
jgi:hypothetical protein